MMRLLLLLPLVGLVLVGCAMFGSWKSIPPPGGCDRCHTLPISDNWAVTYQPVTLTDETGRNPWQTSESMQKPQESRLEQKKLTEQRCFRCHKSPSPAHVERVGRYHH